MAKEIHFNQMAGVPVKYGSRQITLRQGNLLSELHAPLESAFRELWQIAGRARSVQTVGIRGDARSGHHHREGRAFDLSGVLWEGRTVLARDGGVAPGPCLGVEAVIRRHVGGVLDYWYDAGHRDHWHIWTDKGVAVGWRARRSVAVFAQAACAHLLGRPLRIDGIPGPKTMAALRAEGALDDWDGWLLRVAHRGLVGA